MQLAAGVILGVILLVLGANHKDPYLAPGRPWAPWIIAAAGAAGAAALWKRRGLSPAAVVWAVVPVAALAATAAFEARKAAVLSASGETARALGRRFVVGYSSLDEVETLAAKGLIGGVYLTGRNARGRSLEDLRRDVARLQKARRAAGLPPLLIATDQEGGAVSHLSPPLPRLPALSEAARRAPAERVAAARAMGQRQGRLLAGLGVTVNLAPVLDLRRDHGHIFLDRNSRIAQRAISDDPAVVGEVGLAYSRGLEESGVTAVLKHFPGLGRLAVDTHHFPARLDVGAADLEASDWAPFRRVLSVSRAMMMVGHVTLGAVDPERPASRSRPVIDGLLRRTWGYQGVLMTDDMNMSPIYHHGFCGAVEDSLNAGIDFLLLAYDGRQFYRAMRCALRAAEAGRLDRAMLAASEERLSRWFEGHRLIFVNYGE